MVHRGRLDSVRRWYRSLEGLPRIRQWQESDDAGCLEEHSADPHQGSRDRRAKDRGSRALAPLLPRERGPARADAAPDAPAKGIPVRSARPPSGCVADVRPSCRPGGRSRCPFQKMASVAAPEPPFGKLGGDQPVDQVIVDLDLVGVYFRWSPRVSHGAPVHLTKPIRGTPSGSACSATPGCWALPWRHDPRPSARHGRFSYLRSRSVRKASPLNSVWLHPLRSTPTEQGSAPYRVWSFRSRCHQASEAPAGGLP